MFRLRPVFASLVGIMVVLGCQGDSPTPSGPDRGASLSAAGPCKNDAFTSAVAVYADGTVQNAKLQACKDILAAVKQSNLGQAEQGIDALLVAISSDYHGGAAGLTAVGTNTLEQSVANYITAICGLAFAPGDHECLTVNNLDGTAGIDEGDLDGWMAIGPFTSDSLVKQLLPTGLFAVGLEGTDGTSVTVAARPVDTITGPCPENYPNDCQDDVHDVDVDGPFTDLYVESCPAVFGNEHVRCPAGGCEPGDTDTIDLGLVTEGACTLAGYTLMGFWGQFAYQATRPMQWIVHATPAFAGLTTRFGVGSPIVLADDDPRTRTAVFQVNSNYQAGSEGTTIQAFYLGDLIGSCVTVATGADATSSTCSISFLVPHDLELLITAAKTSGGGTYNSTQNLTLTPGNPERGETKLVTIELKPPGGGRGKNK